MATTPQERLAELRLEAEALLTKGIRSADESARVEAILADVDDLKKQVEQNKQIAGFGQWSDESAGKLPVAPAGARGADGQILGFAPAGATQLNVELQGTSQGTRRAIEVADAYGEGGMNEKQRAVTSTPAFRSAWLEYMRTPAGRHVSDTAYRTLNEASDPSGGFLVPEDLQSRVISRLPTPTRIAGRTTQLQTGRDRLTMPKVNYTTDDLYTTGMRVVWTGENPVSSTAMRVTDPVFGQIGISIFTAMISIPVTNDLLEDTDFPLISYLSGKFGETIDLLKDNMVINGTGLGQPTGILANPSVGGTDPNQPKALKSGSNGSIGTTGTFFHSIAFDVPEQYDDNSAWYFNKVSTEQAIAKLVDSNGRFLWGAGLQDSGLEANMRDRSLLGYPVVKSGFMPNIATGAFPIVFGDMSAYYLINRVGFSVQVLRELYAETNQILILGRVRFGGAIAEPWKLRVGQTSA